MLLVALCVATPMRLSAQEERVDMVPINAMDHLYNNPERWSGSHFTEPRSTYERLYFTIGGEVGTMWNYFDELDNSRVGVNGFLRVGYQLAPVHSLEFGLLYGEMEGGESYRGLDLSYLFDITAYASRLETPRRWQLLYKSGVEVGLNRPTPLALSSALRLQYNLSPGVGLYLEPKISGYLSPSSSNYNANSYYRTNTFTSISVGAAFDIDACLADCVVALKSNLLYDLVAAPNIALEVPMGDRWSVAGEWIFPWWTTCNSDAEDNPRNTYQLLNGNLELKYWLGDRSRRDLLTGWSVGLYAGGGLYDLEYETKGYQGEFFIASGVMCGFAHPINSSRSLRLEYSLGVGFLQTDYRYYEEHYGVNGEWHTIHMLSGRYSWIGPTSAKVSLVWLLNSRDKRGGVQ